MGFADGIQLPDDLVAEMRGDVGSALLPGTENAVETYEFGAKGGGNGGKKAPQDKTHSKGDKGRANDGGNGGKSKWEDPAYDPFKKGDGKIHSRKK